MNNRNQYPSGQNLKRGKVASAMKNLLAGQRRSGEAIASQVPEFGTKEYVEGLKGILESTVPGSKVRAAEHGAPGASGGIDLNRSVRFGLGHREVQGGESLDLTHLIITGNSEVLGVVVRSQTASRGYGLSSEAKPMQADIIVLPYGINREEAIGTGTINGSQGRRGETIDMADLRLQSMRQQTIRDHEPAAANKLGEGLSVSIDTNNTMVIVNEGSQPAYIVDGSTMAGLSGENAAYVSELTETVEKSIYPWDPLSVGR